MQNLHSALSSYRDASRRLIVVLDGLDEASTVVP